MLLIPLVHPSWPSHELQCSPPAVGCEEEGNNITVEAPFTKGSIGKSTENGANLMQAFSVSFAM